MSKRDRDGLASGNSETSGTTTYDDPQVDAWLVEEARDAGRRIHELLLADERMLATGFTLLGAAASVAVANDKTHFLMALPFALSVLFCFVEYQHSHVMSLGGYKAVLEEAIDTRVGVPITAWEMTIAPTLHRARGVRMVLTLVVTFYLASVGIALQQAFATSEPSHWGHEHSSTYIVLTILSILFGGIASVIARRAAAAQFVRVRNTTRAELLHRWTNLDRTRLPSQPTDPPLLEDGPVEPSMAGPVDSDRRLQAFSPRRD